MNVSESWDSGQTHQDPAVPRRERPVPADAQDSGQPLAGVGSAHELTGFLTESLATDAASAPAQRLRTYCVCTTIC